MWGGGGGAGWRLLGISGPASTGTLRAWATLAPDGKIRIVLINDDTAHPQTVIVHVPGAHAPATLARLLAPSVGARTGVTLAGQSFRRGTTTGMLGGRPHTDQLAATAAAYSVRLPPASAAMLTLR